MPGKAWCCGGSGRSGGGTGTGSGLTAIAIQDTPTVDLEGDGTTANPITATAKMSTAPGNAITTGPDGGLFVSNTGGGGLTTVTTQDSPTVDFSGDGTSASPITATVKPSTDPGNAVTTGSDGGVFVAPSSGGGLTTVATQDTLSVELTGDGTVGSPITATVSPSTDVGNSIVVGTDGKLFAPPSSGGGLTTVTVLDTPSINLEGDGTAGNPITANMIIDPAADNTIVAGANGLYVPPPTAVFGNSPTGVNLWFPGDPYDYTLASFTAPENGVYDVEFVATGAIDSGGDPPVNWNVGALAKTDVTPGMEFWVAGTANENGNPGEIGSFTANQGTATVPRRVELTAGQVVNGYIEIISPLGTNDPGMARASIDVRGYWAWHKIGELPTP